MRLQPLAIVALLVGSGLSLSVPRNEAEPNFDGGIQFTASDGKNYTVWHSGLTDLTAGTVSARDTKAAWSPESYPVDICGDSSFVDETTGGSPILSDCGCVRDYSNTHNGLWMFTDRGGWNWMMACNSCVFRAHTDNYFTIGVGNTDIRDLVSGAIIRFGRNGLVGASGQMGCKGNFNTAKIIWALYKRGT